jgi:hypothetical protein
MVKRVFHAVRQKFRKRRLTILPKRKSPLSSHSHLAYMAKKHPTLPTFPIHSGLRTYTGMSVFYWKENKA